MPKDHSDRLDLSPAEARVGVHPTETPPPPPTPPLYFYDSRTGCMVPAAIHNARVARNRARNTLAKQRSRAKLKAEIAAV